MSPVWVVAVEFLAPLAMAGGLCAGVGRAICLDRWDADTARTAWRAGLAGVATGGVGLATLWTLAAVAQGALPTRVGPLHVLFDLLYVGLLGGLYGASALLPRLLVGERLEDAPVPVVRVSTGTSVAYLVLVYPVVDFVNNCLVGAGILFPSACG